MFETNLPKLTNDELIDQLIAQVEDARKAWVAIPDYPEDAKRGSPEHTEWRIALAKWAKLNANQNLVAGELSARLNTATPNRRRAQRRVNGKGGDKFASDPPRFPVRRVVNPGGRRALDR